MSRFDNGPGGPPRGEGPLDKEARRIERELISTGRQGNRIYFGYGTNKGGIVQIVDRQKLLQGPKEPTPENLRFPVMGQLDLSPLVGAHTAEIDRSARADAQGQERTRIKISKR